MRTLDSKTYNETLALEHQLEEKIDADVWEMMRDEEEIKLDFKVDTTHYKNLINADGYLLFNIEYYDDEDGLVYEEERDFNEESLNIKLMIYHQIVKHNG